MSSNTYVMNPYYLTHGDLHVRDGDSLPNQLETHIKEGDYFVTLATVLDLIDQRLGQSDSVHQSTLQKAIDDLLYLQRHYRIIKK